jgi:UDP-glucose 4-epimerase
MLGRAILKQLDHQPGVAVLALNQRGEFESALRKFEPTAVIHAAATGMQEPRPEAATLIQVNVELPVRVAEAAGQTPHCHFVYISSGLAYKETGRPLTENDSLGTDHPYGASKAEAEKRVLRVTRAKRIPLTIIRPFSFTGEGDFGTRLFPSLLRSAAERRPFQMSSGDQVRDHSSVSDIARGVIAASQQLENESLRIFNLGSGDRRPVRELVTSVVNELELDVRLDFGSRAKAPHEPMFMVADTTCAQNQLRWYPHVTVQRAVWELARFSFPALEPKEPASHQ